MMTVVHGGGGGGGGDGMMTMISMIMIIRMNYLLTLCTRQKTKPFFLLTCVEISFLFVLLDGKYLAQTSDNSFCRCRCC